MLVLMICNPFTTLVFSDVFQVSAFQLFICNPITTPESSGNPQNTLLMVVIYNPFTISGHLFTRAELMLMILICNPFTTAWMVGDGIRLMYNPNLQPIYYSFDMPMEDFRGVCDNNL